MPHVALVVDDAAACARLGAYLQRHGHRVSTAADAAALWRLLDAPEGGPIDLVLLDLDLPGTDGLDLLRELGHRWRGPLVVASGEADPVERIVALEMGADDCVARPFELREVLARVRAVLRRARRPPLREAPACLAFDGLVLEPVAHRLTGRDGGEIPLTSGEFALLEVLLDHPNQALTRDRLMDRLHGHAAGPFDRAIDMQVARLRRKIERDPAHPRLVRAIRGTGYLLAAPVARDMAAPAAEAMEGAPGVAPWHDAPGPAAGGAAHALANLLTLATGHLARIEDRRELGGDALRDVAMARHALARGSALAAALLSSASRQPPAPRAIPPADVLEGVADLLEGALGASTRLRTECMPGLDDVFVDPAQLDTALVNLAFNARDAMPGGGEITLSAHAQRAPPPGADAGAGGRFVVITVGDTGTGMDAGTLARAVGPRSSTRPAGSGLGLGLVHGFVKRSGGYLHVDSRVGHGTRVALHLPTADPRADPRADARADAG